MIRSFTPLFFVSLVFVGVVYSQEEYHRLPGYVALEELQVFKDYETTLEVQIGESMINMVANAAERENPEFARILRKLKQIRSYSFDLSGTERNKIDQYYEQLNTKLLDEQWEIAYRMRQPEATANIYTKSRDGKIVGMTIFSIDGSEQMNLVNIMGDISMEDISRLAEQFGFPEFPPETP